LLAGAARVFVYDLTMPKCDACGYAHAQAHHCINCGNTDPFRRHRVVKFYLTAAVLVLAAVASVLFYLRYTQIERSVRQAEAAVPHDNARGPSPLTREP